MCQRLLRSLIALPFEGHHSPMHFHSEPEMTRNEEGLDGVNATYRLYTAGVFHHVLWT